jgi:tetratricopeptide (TPR) repeat protein
VIELLLEAGRARAAGDLELAEAIYRRVADTDPRNAIAIVGLAEMAFERGDLLTARALAGRALEIDPDEAAARRLLTRQRRESVTVTLPGQRSWLRRFLDRLLGRRPGRPDLPS